MSERKPNNNERLLERIAKLGNEHPRRDAIALAFATDQARAAALAAVLRVELERHLGRPIEWWTDAELGDWLELTADALTAPRH